MRVRADDGQCDRQRDDRAAVFAQQAANGDRERHGNHCREQPTQAELEVRRSFAIIRLFDGWGH
ncbi:MAG: hypothetical protein KDA63_19560 [Planctomycetales bacterium]|nr:hypothetical protein [Planctomycetales bacterium]